LLSIAAAAVTVVVTAAGVAAAAPVFVVVVAGAAAVVVVSFAYDVIFKLTPIFGSSTRFSGLGLHLYLFHVLSLF